MTASAQKHPVRTLIARMVAGMLIGAGGTALFLYLVGDSVLDGASPGGVVGLVAGMSYALIGLLVGFGIAAPGAGAKLLNVEDADELREEQPRLRAGAIVMFLIGLFLLALVVSGSEGEALIGRDVALIVAGASLVGIVAMTIASRKHTDELTRHINWESSTLTLQLALVIFGAWAALAHLGYVAWVSPLALISILALLQLVVIMVIITRKGMMMPR